jgi:hypothetical protein
MAQIKSTRILSLLMIQNAIHMQEVRIQAQNIEMTKTMNQIKLHNIKKNLQTNKHYVLES